MVDWSNVFEEALPYQPFLDRYGTSVQRERWQAMHSRFSLTAPQSNLLAGFSRRMPVLCLAGTWCGDCINQCPVFDHFAKAKRRLTFDFSIATPIPRSVLCSRSTVDTVCRCWSS